MDFFKQISIFLLLGQTIQHFAPGEKYEKYIKMLLGFMVVAQFAAPLLSFGNKERMEEYENNKETFTKKMEEALQTVDEKWFLYNEQIEEQIEKELENAQTALSEQRELEEANKQADAAVKKKIEVEAVKVEVTAHE